jgi:hypothetical protein
VVKHQRHPHWSDDIVVSVPQPRTTILRFMVIEQGLSMIIA